ncbi:MAG: InlB B-repeat-containing protein [Ruminococcus sp.]|jgi:uncharacterized repeat protein (TIGR02543 family)
MKKRRWLVSLLVVVMVVTMLPVTAFAQTTSRTTGLDLSSQTEAAANEAEGWSWTPKAEGGYTLVLENVNISNASGYAITLPNNVDVDIVLKGSNRIEGTTALFGVETRGGLVTIKGDTSDASLTAISNEDSMWGSISVTNLLIESGNVNTEGDGNVIDTFTMTGGSFVINQTFGGASGWGALHAIDGVSITGGSLEITTSESDGYAIYNGNSEDEGVYIGGNAEVTIHKSYVGIAVVDNGDIEVAGGTVKVNSAYIGMYTDAGDIILSSGNIEITSDDTAVKAVEGIVNFTGSDTGIKAPTPVSVSSAEKKIGDYHDIHQWSTVWSSDDTYHWHECEVEGCTVTDNSQKDSYAKHTYNQAIVSDTYKASDATCTNAATYYYSCVCGKTGTETFESGENADHSMTFTDRVEPTYTKEGNIAYWRCDKCGKYFSDEAGAQEISYEETIIPKLQSSSTIYYALHFDTNGGNRISSIVRESGTVIDLSEYVPVQEGYTFTGWYADAELTQPVTEVTLNSTKTIYAGWEEMQTDTRQQQEIFMTVEAQERDLKNGSRNTMSRICTLKLGFAVDDPDLSLSYETSDPEVATVEDGKITYQGVGTCTVTVTAAATDLCKATSLEITVKVGSLGTPTFTPTVTSRTAQKAFVVTSSTVRGVDGYEVQYSIRDDFWRATTKDFPDTGAKLYRETCTTVHSNMTYYIHVRGYQIIDGEKVYSDWSPVKTIRTK